MTTTFIYKASRELYMHLRILRAENVSAEVLRATTWPINEEL